MKYLLLDGKNVNVGGCKSCPLCNHCRVDGVISYKCNDPRNKEGEIEESIADDHYLSGCPLSQYQSLHHLYVSIKCIYETVKTLYDNFRSWWDGRK